MPTHGDFYAGKGIGHAVLQTSAGLLSVFNTHTCANYSHKYKGDSAYSILTPAPTTPISTKVTAHVRVLHFFL